MTELNSLFAQSSETLTNIISFLRLISPALLGIGVFSFILSFLHSFNSRILNKKEIIGTYNPNLDPNYKEKKSFSHKMQLVSIGVVIISVLPWLMEFFITDPPV